MIVTIFHFLIIYKLINNNSCGYYCHDYNNTIGNFHAVNFILHLFDIDRLTCFGFELVEDLIKEYSKDLIIIDEKINKEKNTKEEMIEDVLQIMNVYTRRLSL